MVYNLKKGGEHIMQKIAPDNLGAIVKEARENAKITVESLAEQLNVTERYIYRIENEGKSRVLKFCTSSLEYFQ